MATGTKKTTTKQAATAQLGYGGELHQVASTPDTRITTNHGVPVSDNQNSLKGGMRGSSASIQNVKGRKVGILVSDGADGKVVKAVQTAAEGAGATVMIIAPKIGGVTLKGGRELKADAQLAGAPWVLLDAVAVVLSSEGCAQLLKDGAAVDFVNDAFGHLKAIGFTKEAQPLLDKAGVEPDDGVIDLAKGAKAFLAPAATRQWEREPSVRTLA
jgi:catalase